MDNVQWESAIVYQQVKRNMENSRYRHDLAQAEIMARKLKGHQRPGQAEDEKISLGLRGLEEAEKREREDDPESALRMYELSIDLLLKCLRSASSDTAKKVISERAKVALSQAENLKMKIAREGNGNGKGKRATGVGSDN